MESGDRLLRTGNKGQILHQEDIFGSMPSLILKRFWENCDGNGSGTLTSEIRALYISVF